MPEPICFETRDFTTLSSRSQARATNSVVKPVKMPLEPVRQKSVNEPALWAFAVSPKKRITSSVSSLLYHHVVTPNGRAMESPFLIGRTFSSFSGRTIPAIPAPNERQNQKINVMKILNTNKYG